MFSAVKEKSGSELQDLLQEMEREGIYEREEDCDENNGEDHDSDSDDEIGDSDGEVRDCDDEIEERFDECDGDVE